MLSYARTLRKVELHVDGPTTTMMVQKVCLSVLKQDGLKLELYNLLKM